MNYYLIKMALNNDNKITKRTKIVLLGSVKTGKTIFCTKAKSNRVDKDLQYISTIGGGYYPSTIIIENVYLDLDLWDASGQERFYQLNKIFYKNADIIGIFYNSYDISSFETAKRLIKECKENNNGNNIFVLIRSRYDECLKKNDNKNIVSDEEALEYADLNDLYYTHLSSFEKIETSFKELIKIFYKK